MQCVKSVDKRAAIMPWDDKSELQTLNGDEIMLVPYKNIRKYIIMPQLKEEQAEKGRTYYSNGARIKTSLSVHNFVER